MLLQHAIIPFLKLWQQYYFQTIEFKSLNSITNIIASNVMISERKYYIVDVRFFRLGRSNFYWVILSTVFEGPVNWSLQIP
jgi:hypothetical protein